MEGDGRLEKEAGVVEGVWVWLEGWMVTGSKNSSLCKSYN